MATSSWAQTTAGNPDLTQLVRDAMVTGAAQATPNKDEAIHFALVPAGHTLETLEDYQFPDGRRPEWIKGKVNLYDSASFVGYVSAFTDDRTRVFANPRGLSVEAFLDYHVAGERKAEFLAHRAVFQMEQDERWKIWSNKDGFVFSQADFAEFIEDNYLDIDTPPAAAMLEVARDLHAKNDVSFDSKVSLKDGQTQFSFQEVLKAGVGTGNLEVPEKFTIRIPVFYGEAPVVLDIRLRYRISNQKLVFFYRMYRKQETLQRAFKTAVADIATGLKTEVLMGAPQV